MTAEVWATALALAASDCHQQSVVPKVGGWSWCQAAEQHSTCTSPGPARRRAPLVVLPPPAARGALVAPALADGEPLGGQRERLALVQHQARQGGRQLRAQRHAPAALVLRRGTPLMGGGCCKLACPAAERRSWRAAQAGSRIPAAHSLARHSRAHAAIKQLPAACPSLPMLACRLGASPQLSCVSSAKSWRCSRRPTDMRLMCGHQVSRTAVRQRASKLYSCWVISSPALRTNRSSDSSTGHSNCSKPYSRLTASNSPCSQALRRYSSGGKSRVPAHERLELILCWYDRLALRWVQDVRSSPPRGGLVSRGSVRACTLLLAPDLCSWLTCTQTG